MKMTAQKYLLILLTSGLLTACTTSPTGRSQLMAMPDNQVNQMGAQSFAQLKRSKPATRNGVYTAFVNCVAQAITRQVGGQWEIVVFENKELNAFALPGNKIGVYTGLVSMVDNQHQLAAVIGHEVGHVLAKHSNERMSQETLAQQGVGLITKAIGTPTSVLGQLGVAAIDPLVSYGLLLPYSRTQESEADIIGLNLMAKSGFNPQQSVALWQKMAQASQGQQAPEWMSTHPADTSRIAELTKNMPAALQTYQQAASLRPNCSK
jgi:predicted Zn-dependent protease